MALFTLIPFVAALYGLVLAIAGVWRRPRALWAWCFAAGMVTLALDSLFTGFSLRSSEVDEGVRWLARSLAVTALAPLPWLWFSFTYARGERPARPARLWVPLVLFGLVPAVLALGVPEPLVRFVPPPQDTALGTLRFGAGATVLNVLLLVAFVLVLVNLEQTLRASVGTIRWRIKFVVLGLVVIIGSQLFSRSQALLFLTPSLALSGVESSALLIGCLLLTIAHLRTGMAPIDVYPSTVILRSSVTILLVGGYLFVVGLLAQLVDRLGGPESFQFQAFVVLVGLAGLTVLLLSDRLRLRIRTFVATHFGRSRHDSARIWTRFSEGLAAVTDRAGLCAAAARSISETFEVLSVTVWVADERDGQLEMGASTAESSAPGNARPRASRAVAAGLGERRDPFDLETVREPWADELRGLNPDRFSDGGRRWVVPLQAHERRLGAIVLGDRVNQAAYTTEERELLSCIGAQVSSTLMSLRLADEVALARELDAFRTMSAFFVHDLKNTAAALTMTLRNLPAHFDDPAFREDALRVVGNASRRIDEMIARLGSLRERPHIRPVPTDLSAVVRDACERAGAMPGIDLVSDLQPVPAVMADAEQMRSVFVNLLVNARDALDGHGRIELRTLQDGPLVVASVTDNGPGMSAEFVSESLFRPFRSTKKNGLGIGLYQSYSVVRLHGGTMQVESRPGAGTTFRVSLPASRPQEPPGAPQAR